MTFSEINLNRDRNGDRQGDGDAHGDAQLWNVRSDSKENKVERNRETTKCKFCWNIQETENQPHSEQIQTFTDAREESQDERVAVHVEDDGRWLR